MNVAIEAQIKEKEDPKTFSLTLTGEQRKGLRRKEEIIPGKKIFQGNFGFSQEKFFKENFRRTKENFGRTKEISAVFPNSEKNCRFSN